MQLPNPRLILYQRGGELLQETLLGQLKKKSENGKKKKKKNQINIKFTETDNCTMTTEENILFLRNKLLNN